MLPDPIAATDTLETKAGAGTPETAAGTGTPETTAGTRTPETTTGTSINTGSFYIEVAVVYALPQCQELVRLMLPMGSTLRQALDASGLLQKYPEIDLTRYKLGIFGKVSKADTLLRQDDRIEIYRPLIADPKEVRKQRAAEGKTRRKGGGKEA